MTIEEMLEDIKNWCDEQYDYDEDDEENVEYYRTIWNIIMNP